VRNMTQKVLFICTGNYYRSRFAETLFNALAMQKNLDWCADSRGLKLGRSNVGPVYPGVLDQLMKLGFPAEARPRAPIQLGINDLEAADLIVVLNESEHRVLMLQRFEQWTDQVVYWNVPDLNLMKTEDAFSRIEEHVSALIQQLQDQQTSFETSH
jgi:protein-tyrosine phosphatase